MSGKPTSWLTREIRQLMHTRDYHLRRFKNTKLDTHWASYKNLRNTVNNKIRTAKANHIKNVFRESYESSDKPNDFWKQIKKCYDSYGPSKSFTINGTNVSDPRSIANAFCTFLTKVGSSLMNCSLSMASAVKDQPATQLRKLPTTFVNTWTKEKLQVPSSWICARRSIVSTTVAYSVNFHIMVLLIGRLNGSAAICSTRVKSLSSMEFCQTGSTSHAVFYKARFWDHCSLLS